jgi:hypothetical protein
MAAGDNSDDILFRELPREEFDNVYQFLLSDFRQTEPLNAALELTVEECSDFFKDLVDAAQPDLSYVAETRDGRIAGVCLACIINRPNGSETEDGGIITRDSSEKVKEIKRIINTLEEQVT